MSRNRVKESFKSTALALFLTMLLLFPSSCIVTTGKNEAEVIENFLQKVDAMDGEMTVVTKGGETLTIMITKETPPESQEDDNPKDNQESAQVEKDSSGSVAPASILPSLECIEDVFEVLGVWEDAHALREKGLSWSHVAAELGYSKDTMYAHLQEIAEERLKDAREAGLISQELLEKKFTYFSEIALKWVNKIFTE